MNRGALGIGLAAALLLGSALASGPVPEVKGGKAQVLAVEGLDSAVAKLAASGKRTLWMGWSARSLPGNFQMCCHIHWRAGVQLHGSGIIEMGSSKIADEECVLEGEDNWVQISKAPEGPREELFFVLVRLHRGEVDRIRVSSADCVLRGAGRDFYWLTGVAGEDSVAWLAAHLEGTTDEERVSDPALTAVALHDLPSAGRVLEEVAAGGRYAESLRQEALFWLGSTRGAFGFEVLRRMASSERDPEIRREIPFGLGESGVPEATDLLIRMARRDVSADVRREALFWLAQKAGEKVAGVISDAIENDPETEVKKAAVFALAEMPDRDGVPLLIDLIENHSNPVVRKEAMFWLAESDDPRALDFIEKILNG
jgi:hypothetical protein